MKNDQSQRSPKNHRDIEHKPSGYASLTERLAARTCSIHPNLPVLDLSAAIPSDCFGLHNHAHPFPSSERYADPETGRMKKNEQPHIPTVRPCYGVLR